MFRKNALAAAVRLAVVVSATSLMYGCLSDEGSNSTSTTRVGGLYSQVTAPRVTVVGAVQDTNGMPIEGAKVYLGGKIATTNAGGQYYFNDVAVTNTVNLSNGTTQQALMISIVPPAGYLGATVTVTPEAQIDGNNESSTDAGGDLANQVTTFISGYTAQAGTAVLPGLGATVSGTLRNQVTGEPIPSHDVALDMESVNGVAQQQVQNGVATSYATIPFSATTDGSGHFVISNVPNDSQLRFVVGGYTVNTVTANASGISVLTNDEVAEVAVSDVFVSPITGGDAIAPYIVDVSGVAANNMLDKGVDGTGGITIYFSEALATTPDSLYDLVVRDVTNGSFIALSGAATLSADGKSLHFATATAFPAGATIEINVVQVDLQDMSGNVITKGAAADAFGYDTIVVSTSGSNYLRLTLQAWQEANIDASAVTSMTQQNRDDTGVDDVAAVQGLNLAFTDAWDDGGTDPAGFDVQQLNAADDDDGVGGIDAASRLSGLMTAINGGSAIAVGADYGRVVFTPSNASFYQFDVTRGGNSILAAVNAYPVSGNVTPGIGNSFTLTDTNQVALVLDNVQPGDVVTITPFDDLSYAGTPQSITLVDNVRPTTVLQRAYGLVSHQAPDVVTDYGSGAELSQIGDATLYGTPYLNVTMGLLDNINEAGDSLDEELIDHNTVNTTTGNAYITVPNVYDATAYSVFAAAQARTIGVAFSEDVTLTGTPGYGGGVQLTSWTVHNDVVSTDNGTISHSDLIDVDVANVTALANSDHNRVIDFSGVVADKADAVAGATVNVADNAKVVVRDMMPPMVVSASYIGSRIELQFNEAIAPQVDDTLQLVNATGGVQLITLSQATVDAFNLQADKTRLNILSSDWGDNVTWSTMFNLGTYADVSTGNAQLAHGSIDTGEIADIRGNTMNATNAGVTPVRFAFYNALGTMTVGTPSAPTFVATATGFTVTYVSNHAIDLTASFGAASKSVLTGAEVAGAFTLTSAATINTATSSASLSADGKTLTVTVGLTGTLASGNSFDAAANLVSDYDATQNVNPAAVTAP